MLQTFFLIYSFVILGYFGTLYCLILVRKRKPLGDYEESFSVIIPCYNEPYKNLKDCVGSLIRAKGEKQIILIDNNSNDPETLRAIDEYRKNDKVLVLTQRIQGKRYAHAKGLAYAQNEIVVFVHSKRKIVF